MRICIYPVTTLAVHIARLLAERGYTPQLIDDFSGCEKLHELVEPLYTLAHEGRLAIADAKPGSRGYKRLTEHCDMLLLAWHPGEARVCPGRLRDSILAVLDSSCNLLHVTVPLGAYAWEGQLANGLPRVKPQLLEYSVPLSALLAHRGEYAAQVLPVLLGGVGYEYFDWVTQRKPRRGSKLEVLHVGDAAEAVLEAIEAKLRDWTVTPGVVIDADEAARVWNVEPLEPLEPQPPLTGGKPKHLKATCDYLSSLSLPCTAYNGGLALSAHR